MFSRSFKYNSQSPPQDGLLSSPSYTEVDFAGTLPAHRLHSDGIVEMEEDIGKSLAGLGLEGNDSFPNSDMSDSTFDRKTNIGMDASMSQHTIDSINPRLSLASANNSIHRARSTSRSLQVPSAAQSSSVRRYPVPWSSVESSANLCPPTYTPHGSCASTHSHRSDSTWETIPSTPSTDEFDIRPMPDDNSASMQSYNHPRTGIWEGQESAYGGHISMRNTRDGDGISPPKLQSLSQNFQQVFDNADAATPFGTELHFNGIVDAALGGYGTPQPAISPLSTPSTTRGPVPQFNQASFGARPEISLRINNARDFEGSLVQQPPEVEQYFDHLSSDFLQSRPPRFALDDSPPPASSSISAVLTDLPVPALTPSTSADRSTTHAVDCPYCPKKFNGEKRMDTLRRHNRLEHSNRPKLVCPMCQLVIASRRLDNLKRHFQKKHPNYPLPALLNVRKARSVPNQRHP